MKLILVILTLFSTTALAALDLHKKISIVAENEPVAEVLKKISTQADVDLKINAYSPTLKRVSIEVKEATLKEVLDAVTSMAGLTWAVDDERKIIILSK